jgi:hypothetical protein
MTLDEIVEHYICSQRPGARKASPSDASSLPSLFNLGGERELSAFDPGSRLCINCE